MHVRFLCFPLVKLAFELKFSTRDTTCWSAIQVHLTYCVVRARFDTSPKREATSRSVNLFREPFQVVNRIVTKSLHFVSGALRVRSLALMNIHC